MPQRKAAADADLAAFYPIVPDSAWAKRIVPLGVKTLQLRLKDVSGEAVRREIIDTLDVCVPHGCQLIVNDHWREAISAGADYVHLGQEDLAAADLPKIKAAGVRFGVSTHSAEELDVALQAEPDYVALGPLFETKLKAMRWAPHGLAPIATWRARIGALPLVGIAGITPERAPDVLRAGADSVAVITDFLTHPRPEERIETWLALNLEQHVGAAC